LASEVDGFFHEWNQDLFCPHSLGKRAYNYQSTGKNGSSCDCVTGHNTIT